MASILERLERLENDRRFRQWLHFERFLEGLSDEQLEVYARHGCLPDPLPEPLPIGASRLDRLDRKTLIGMWKENEREFGERSQDELDFFCAHGHWPAQVCNEGTCQKAEWDKRGRDEEEKGRDGAL